MRVIKNKGFTLLEIIIVIIIIAILASIAAPRIIGALNMAKLAEAEKTLAVVRADMEPCYQLAGNSYVGCTSSPTFTGKYFSAPVISANATGYTATMNALSPLTPASDYVILTGTGSTGKATMVGYGVFSGLNQQ